MSFHSNMASLANGEKLTKLVRVRGVDLGTFRELKGIDPDGEDDGEEDEDDEDEEDEMEDEED